jgi:hypothetical protein
MDDTGCALQVPVTVEYGDGKIHVHLPTILQIVFNGSK